LRSTHLNDTHVFNKNQIMNLIFCQLRWLLSLVSVSAAPDILNHVDPSIFYITVFMSYFKFFILS